MTATEHDQPGAITPDAALKLLEHAAPQRYAKVFERGSLTVEIYRPVGTDLQKPHRQDELYVIVSGRGVFFDGVRRHPFGPGDVLFVPAGREHRFEAFDADFATWVFFYGPDGGELGAG